MNKDWKYLVTTKAESWLGKVHTPLLLKELAWRLVVFAAKCGKSNPISFALRPIVSHRHWRTGVGLFLAVLAILGGLGGSSPVPGMAEATGGEVGVVVADTGEVKLNTQEAVKMPVANFRLSQKFWVLHSGIDMAAAMGEPVKPIMKGTVVKVDKSWGGYGTHVIVDHPGNYQTLYAHLSKVNVAEGQEVTNEMQIGAVGSTGRSTGPHLHLEVREEGKLVNPAAVLGIR